MIMMMMNDAKKSNGSIAGNDISLRDQYDQSKAS